MLKRNILLFVLFIVKLAAQPIPSHYYLMEQKDSLYYLVTDNSLMKFYSNGASGEFFLTNYKEKTFPSWVKLMLNDEYLFTTSDGANLYCYSNKNAWDLNLVNVFNPGHWIHSMHGFGPYFFIRSGDVFSIYKIQNDMAILVDDSLFTSPLQSGIFFSYPFVVLDNIVYKFIEGFGFYAVDQLSISTTKNTGLTNNTLIRYHYWVTGTYPPPIIHSVLDKTIIEEPSFPTYTYSNWGLNIGPLNCAYCTGTLIAKENLYYMNWAGVITTHNSQLAYMPTSGDRATITDNYIFLLGNDSLRYSKWNYGSVFYPFTWTDWTSVEESEQYVKSFQLFQNYPNPFNPSTKIRFEIPERSFVTITVYDVLGNDILTLINEEMVNGSYEVEFNGKGLVSGIYYYRITAGDFSQTKKMILLK